MPAADVYSVDFKNGNLVPSLDTHDWGPMVLGDSGPAANPLSSGDPQGLTLSVTAAGGAAAIGVHVVLGDGELDLATRLTMRVEFERPDIMPPAPPATGGPEPWAVALVVKFGDQDFEEDEAIVPVTCQFRPNGVRLNTPGHLEGDQAAMLITPLNYGGLTPGRFTLEHHFCGVNAAGRYAVGYGSLDVGPPIKKNDVRVYSNAGLSDGTQAWIGALGVNLVTLTGSGTINVRLRSFSVRVWA